MSSLQQDASNAVEYHIDQVEVRRFRRRIDWLIMPALVIVFFRRFLDKQAVNYALVFGLDKTLHLTDLVLSSAVSLFHVGQSASQYPFAYFVSRWLVIRVVSCAITAYRTVEMCIAVSNNFHGLAATTFFLSF